MASALEQYVNTVQTLSTQGNFAQLCDFIGKSAEVLGKNVTHLDNVLATLDIQQHSLGILGILCVKYNVPNIPDFETLFVQTQEFIISCNGEHVRYATESYADLCHKFTHNLVERKQPLRGITILVTAIQKIQLFPAQLTSIHSDLCQLCLLSKNMKPALQFMDVDITDVSKEGGHYDAKDFLCFYYYGGMIYTALKQYERALYFFEIAITTPSLAVSLIMLEAYKKYILISLIVNGKFPNLPKYTSQVVARYIKPLCQGYHDLSNAYASNNPEEVRKSVERHQDTFNRAIPFFRKGILFKFENYQQTVEILMRWLRAISSGSALFANVLFIEENNMGLVKQCVTSMYKKNIQRLTKTFLTLSLTDMANRVKLPSAREAEKYVLHMIEDGEIYATINQRDGMVRFHDNPEKYNSAGMLLRLDQEMQKCIQLDAKLKDMDNEIAVNPQYVQKSSGMHDDDLPGTSKMQTF